MNSLKIYDKEFLDSLTLLRKGETKFGEKVGCIGDLDELKKHKADYVVLGIPEDVGVLANFGKKGTSEAWDACLRSLLNMQANTLSKPENIIILGELDFRNEMRTAHMLDPEADNFGETIGKLVEKIDLEVSQIIRTIVAAGKIPLVVGGGHNNSLGILKGSSDALGTPLNVINLDAHSDFKPLEHRHSGNAFSYAMEKGYIYKYGIFGIHKSYTSQEVYNRMEQFKDRIGFYFFEDVILRENPPFKQAVKVAKQFIRDRKFGLEIDVDAIEAFTSSAMTPSGFSMTQARQFARFFSKSPVPSYIHICEAIPSKSELDTVGKALAYLIVDVTV
ncbi:MAG: formimidoylglutamase [Bacteroidia bacterium]|nr:formimidoylglutamase [Bacteroidia bacterium]NNF31969.1 formimidoylglutamase [Flavobacteriaceae bacterium]MBT8276193.1 formimidoylglutamase [Bacteroidia bacterium]NNJ83059.1 formimidoylglutamase [Flavobacteriaceae bacterium]NNK52968.1 formimidoylglutamase [Flavobacteriaceae bacterium]